MVNEIQKAKSIYEAFTPTQPIALPDLLSGRRDLLHSLMRDIFIPSQHILLYGDRGVGKTSIARVLGILAQDEQDQDGRRSIFVSCDSNDSFESIWRKVFQEILVMQRQVGFEGTAKYSLTGRWEPPYPIQTPNDVRLVLNSLPNPPTIIIDEFDRIESGGEACRLMTDTVKLLSDTMSPCSIVLVGVGQSIEELISAHESISRNIDYVSVDPLRTLQLAEIVQKGMKQAELTFDNGLDIKIARLSQGYPHYTHLLGQCAAEQALDNGRRHVTTDDLRQAIPLSIGRATGGIRIEYDKATESTQPNNLFRQVLLACALAPKDVRGRFPLRALQEPLEQILGRPISQSSYQRHLALFCEEDRGCVLIKSGRSRNFRWSFANPQLIPFIYLEGIQDELIADDLNHLI